MLCSVKPSPATPASHISVHIPVLEVPLTIQLPANAPVKAAENGQVLPVTHAGDPAGVPGTCPQPDTALAITREENQ